MTPPGIHLWIPGLLGPVPPGLAVQAELPGLHALLARASAAATPAMHHVAREPRVTGRMLADLLEPLAPTAAGASTNWLIASPLNLVPDRDTLRVLDAATLTLSQADADALCAELNSLFDDDGLHVSALAPTLWIASMPLDRTIPAGLAPASALTGQRFADFLPAGDGAREWVRLLNELQMALYGSSVSVQRAATGLPRVTGVWLWGAESDSSPDAALSSWSLLCCDDPLLKALAKASRCEWQPAPTTVDALLDDWQHLAAAGRSAPSVFVEIDGAPVIKDGRSFVDWEQWLIDFDRDWLVPLDHARLAGQCPAIGIADGRGREWLCRRHDRYRVWRRPRRLPALFAEEESA